MKCPVFEYFLDTNITDQYFSEEDQDIDFIDWLNDKIDEQSGFIKQEVAKNFDNFRIKSFEVSSSFIDKGHHTLIIYVKINFCNESSDDEVSLEVFNQIVEDKEIMDFIENTLIPNYIDIFNKASTVVFPVSISSNSLFANLEFKDIDFYSRIIEHNGEWIACSLKSETLTVINKLTRNF